MFQVTISRPTELKIAIAWDSKNGEFLFRCRYEYLIQEASMAFTKTLMSVVGFLRFIPSSKLHAKEGEQIIDLSSASVTARQVLEDTLTFFYLPEPKVRSPLHT